HRTLRELAERLASLGYVVARLDYDGTGDSAGDQWDGERVSAWRRSVANAAADLRLQGCSHVQAIGVRLGATLALLDGAQLGLDGVAAWSPVVNGRRWARELRLLGQAVPAADDGLGGGTVASAGVVFGATTLAELGALSIAKVDAAPAPRVLLVDGVPDEKAVEHLVSLGVAVDARAVDGGESALELATEDAVVPEDVVATICSWIAAADEGAVSPGSLVRAVPSASAEFAWQRARLRESVMTLGSEGVVGVRTEPLEQDPAPGTLVFLNTGSEPHVGPGRAWVEFARALAVRGHTSYRVDWRGWGESPDGDHAPGRPYDPHTVAETTSIVRALSAIGHDDIVLCGLCASAWVALRAILEIDVAGVVAINPQLYWEPGDPVEATMAETRLRRAGEILAIERGAAWGRWTLEDLDGARPWAAAWLDGLAAAATPVTMMFAEGDDGLQYLRTRLGRRLSDAQRAGVRTVELPEVDHSMHRVWTRGVVIDAVEAAVARMVVEVSPTG
ncbi:MAG: hypothetical protein JWQ20_114, partial [Conexibacter sp.]|nr:hypothetical protein [Conexibacter sp.]